MTPILKKHLKRLIGILAFVAMFSLVPHRGEAHSLDASIGGRVFLGDILNNAYPNTTQQLGLTTFWNLNYGQVKRNFIILCHTNGGSDNQTAVHFLKVNQVNSINTLDLTTITGKNIVCPNETVTYSVPTNAGTTWVWGLTTGGQILTANNNTVTVKWNNQPGTGPHKLTVKVTDNSGVAQTGELVVSIRDIYLNCISSLNIGTDNNCKATLTTERMLSGTHIGAADMKIQIIDISKNVILEEGIGSVDIDGVAKDGSLYDFIGKTFTTKVIEPCNNNYCLGAVKVNDYSAPMLTAPADMSFSCAQLNGLNPATTLSSVPTINDCSTGSTYAYVDFAFENACTQPFTALPAGVPAGHTLPTTGDVIKILVRTFTAD